MRTTKRDILELSLAAVCLAAFAAGCGSSSTSSDVAYEDDYAGDYYYPADVAYSGLYGAGWGYYGLYALTPGLPPQLLALGDGGVLDGGAAGTSGAAGNGGAAGTSGAAGTPGAAGTSGAAGTHGAAGASGAAGATGAGGSGSSLSGNTTVRGAVGEAIRLLALGADVCPGHATVSRPGGSNVCGISGAGLMITFNACPLSAGGTVDGSFSVQFNISASDTNCDSATTLSVGYVATTTNLTYTGTGGAKIVIPTQTDMATVHVAVGQAPTTITVMSSGEIQRLKGDGSTASDRTYTGSRSFSAISVANHTYTVDGMINVTDKAGGTATISATGLKRERTCCKPTGGTIDVSRTGGSHSGNHSWTFSATCGSATLDGKTVMLPACL